MKKTRNWAQIGPHGRFSGVTDAQQIHAVVRGHKPIYLGDWKYRSGRVTDELKLARRLGLRVRTFEFRKNKRRYPEFVAFVPGQERHASRVEAILRHKPQRNYHGRLGKLLGYTPEEIAGFKVRWKSRKYLI